MEHLHPEDDEPENAAQVEPADGPANFQIYDHSLGTGTTFLPDRHRLLPFLTSPIPCLQKIQCTITRHRTGVHKWAPGYEVFLEFDQQKFFLLSAQKKQVMVSNTYCIYSQPLVYANKCEPLGKLKSNFMGTVFTLYGPSYLEDKVKKKDELAKVLYDKNILGFKGPRKMTLVMPRVNSDGTPVRITPKEKSETLQARMESGDNKDILVLHNKSPQWNEESHSYVLNFNGRVTVASVKNFQIVHDLDLDYIIMQFGRAENGAFCMDCQYPISPLQCFGVCLSSFDPKLACE